MKLLSTTRWGLAGVMLTGAAYGAFGQQPATTLPVTQPTGSVAASAATSVAEDKPLLEKEVAPRTRVTWMGGKLTISAENSSLNQILREISRQTGMKVTGGVRDERVFGSYGPGTPDAVLVSLLTGTGSNMLLKEDAAGGPKELVLTARAGGATPPSPGGRDAESDEEQVAPQRQLPSRPRPQAFRPPPGMSVPEAGYNGGQGASNGQGANGGQAVPDAQGSMGAAGTTPSQPQPTATPTDQPVSDTAKTPQEIYDQLVKMQQQKAAQTPP